MPDCCHVNRNMIGYDHALDILLGEARSLPFVNVSPSDAVGKVLARFLAAPMSVPSFDNSAMDGFAFNAEAVAGATDETPIVLHVAGASIAGDSAELSHLHPGTAVKIMTGAPLPEGADTVLPVEAASWDHEELTFTAPYPAFQHVRRVGQDIEAGKPLLAAGTRLTSAHIPLLSAVGLGRVPVYQAPSAFWISTGQEITDNFDTPLLPGHIYNATRHYGEKHLPELGMEIKGAMTVRDTPQDFAAALEKALDHGPDIILSTGGISAGQYDFVRPVLEDMGADIIFHKARIKPAKPVLFAVLPDGRYFFGLPGNPISTALALRIFVYPFVRALTGDMPEAPRKARLAADCKGPADKTAFLMGTVSVDDDGMVSATPDTCQQSFQTRPFAASNAWLILPEGTDCLPAGTLVDWLPIRPGVL